MLMDERDEEGFVFFFLLRKMTTKSIDSKLLKSKMGEKILF